MYMKRFLPVMALVVMVQLADAQRTTQYITHTIQKGETLSALSARYKTTVGDIMRLNGMHTNSKLSIGQKVKIPVNGSRVQREETAAAPAQQAATPAIQQQVQAAQPAAGSGAVHIVKKGETLYKISRDYHVTINQLKQWNNLSGDKVSIGQHLVVGAGETAAAAQQPQQVAPQPAATTPVQQAPASQPERNTTTPANTTAPNTASPATAQPAQQQQPAVTQPVSNSSTVPATTAPASQPEHTSVTSTSVSPAVAKAESEIDPAKVGPAGYFAPLFGVDVEGRSLADLTGTAMTFKTESGWVDKKYYILVNNVSPGSIVKVSTPDGSKTIYAKVLWNMKDMKENEGLTFRISSAAADALGITSDRFDLRIAYYD
jgi:LysM repeat protein